MVRYGQPVDARKYANAIRLQDGRVLVVGGSGSDSTQPPLTCAEIFDLATLRWSATASTRTLQKSPTTIPLSTGKVLMTEGSTCPEIRWRPRSCLIPHRHLVSYREHGHGPRPPSSRPARQRKVLVAGGENSQSPNRTLLRVLSCSIR